MNNIDKVRAVVARFFQVKESEMTSAYVFPRQRLDGSMGRNTFHAAIKRLAQVDLPSALTAHSFGELIQGLPADGAVVAPAVAASAPTPTAAPAARPTAPGGFQLQTGVDIEALDGLPADGTPELAAFIAEHFTDAEAGYAKQQTDPRMSLLGLWAAKEAVLKCGWVGTLKFREIEVVHNAQRQPAIRLLSTVGRPGQHAISISHTGTFAIAICVRTTVCSSPAIRVGPA